MLIERDYSAIDDIEIKQNTTVFDELFLTSIYILSIYEKECNNKYYNIYSNANESDKNESDKNESDKITTESIINSETSSDHNNIPNTPLIDLIVIDTNILYNYMDKIIVLGLELYNRIPFKKVYIHDTIDNISHEKLFDRGGIDILRLISLSNINQNTILENINKNLLFCNKIFEIFKFSSEYILDDSFEKTFTVDFNNIDTYHKWIINKTMIFGKEITDYMDNFQFEEALQIIYFHWNNNIYEKYINLIKSDLTDEIFLDKKDTAKLILFNILITSLKITHPFMPFLTQYMYGLLRDNNSILCTRPWPKFDDTLFNNVEDIEINS